MNDFQSHLRLSELLLFVVCSNNDCILHCFWDITTYTVYVTACDLEKSFSFEKIVEITSHKSTFQLMC